VDALVAQGVLVREPDGMFAQTKCRLAYIKFLKTERRGSASTVAQTQSQLLHHDFLHSVQSDRASHALAERLSAKCWHSLHQEAALKACGLLRIIKPAARIHAVLPMETNLCRHPD
jgi:hypothetical protein